MQVISRIQNLREACFVKTGTLQSRTVHRGTGGARAPQTPRWGALGGTAIGVPGNVFTLYIYFTNGSRSVIADFS